MMSQIFKNNKNFLGKLKQFLKVRKRKPVLHYLETHVVDHCNLNCKACSHFSPLANENFVDIEKYKKNIIELSGKLRFKNIRLLGGEPLLHPDIVKFIQTTKNAFPKAHLSIVTNGSLLFNMSDDFWDACRKNNVAIDVSKYPPLKDKFKEMLTLIKSKEVEVGDVHDCNEMYIFHNPNGDSDIDISYKYCAIKRYKILKEDKLYACPKSAYIHLFDTYYNLKSQKDTGVKIKSASSKKLVNAINKPICTCGFCSYAPRMIDWELSQKNKSDWDVIEDPSKIKQFNNFVLKEMEKNSKNR